MFIIPAYLSGLITNFLYESGLCYEGTCLIINVILFLLVLVFITFVLTIFVIRTYKLFKIKAPQQYLIAVIILIIIILYLFLNYIFMFIARKLGYPPEYFLF